MEDLLRSLPRLRILSLHKPALDIRYLYGTLVAAQPLGRLALLELKRFRLTPNTISAVRKSKHQQFRPTGDMSHSWLGGRSLNRKQLVPNCRFSCAILVWDGMPQQHAFPPPPKSRFLLPERWETDGARLPP